MSFVVFRGGGGGGGVRGSGAGGKIILRYIIKLS